MMNALDLQAAADALGELEEAKERLSMAHEVNESQQEEVHSIPLAPVKVYAGAWTICCRGFPLFVGGRGSQQGHFHSCLMLPHQLSQQCNASSRGDAWNTEKASPPTMLLSVSEKRTVCLG